MNINSTQANPLRRSILSFEALFVISMLIAPNVILHAEDVRYVPDWAGISPNRVIQHTETKGDAIAKAVAALRPGDQLVIAAGTYSVEKMWDIRVSGTAKAPIWIVAQDGARVVITRPNAKQNVLNIGQGGPVQYLCLRGVEITGGSHGLRLGQCTEVWIDRCHVHHTGDVCLSANSANTRRLFLTRNHNHHGGGQGEAIVRNNILISAASSGFASTDHQGKTLNLQVVHNTIINASLALSGGSWNGREGMVVANNILYSRDKNALHFANGKEGVTIAGNVILGSVLKEGAKPGRGLNDFQSLTWDGEKYDATPTAEAPFEEADRRFFVNTDFANRPRSKALSGAVAR